MRTLREGGVSDLRFVYDFENVPIREEIMDSEMLPWDQFFASEKNAMDSGTQKYFLLENSDIPEGYVRFTYKSELWYASAWGRWIKTLIHCGMLAAFDYLKIPFIVWNIREANKRWLKVCEKYPFQLVGENSLFVTLSKPPYLAVAKFFHYTIQAETFFEKREVFEKYSLPVQVRW